VKSLICPCGEELTGTNDSEFVECVNKHLEVVHPDLVGKYTPEEMLSRAQDV
jgi:hypothetical protein